MALRLSPIGTERFPDWVARSSAEYAADPSAWWVGDIVIDENQRRRGYGREAMRLAEAYARTHGAASLGLSVFGFNQAARTLYEALGFETTRVEAIGTEAASIKMRKRL